MVEIERKFLVDTKKWQPSEIGIEIKQGYLSTDPERTVRVRLAGNRSFLTIKGKTVGITRTELEYEIPVKEAEVLFKLCIYHPVEKIRYLEQVGGLIWEIDVFEGQNKGLVIAEVELESEKQKFLTPEWIKNEVSGDLRFYNSSLSKKPFSIW